MNKLKTSGLNAQPSDNNRLDTTISNNILKQTTYGNI